MKCKAQFLVILFLSATIYHPCKISIFSNQISPKLLLCERMKASTATPTENQNQIPQIFVALSHLHLINCWQTTSKLYVSWFYCTAALFNVTILFVRLFHNRKICHGESSISSTSEKHSAVDGWNIFYFCVVVWNVFVNWPQALHLCQSTCWLALISFSTRLVNCANVQ